MKIKSLSSILIGRYLRPENSCGRLSGNLRITLDSKIASIHPDPVPIVVIKIPSVMKMDIIPLLATPRAFKIPISFVFSLILTIKELITNISAIRIMEKSIINKALFWRLSARRTFLFT